MLTPHPPKLFRITTLLIFLCLIALDLGKGKFPFAASQNIETVPAPAGDTGNTNPGGITRETGSATQPTLSPTRSQPAFPAGISQQSTAATPTTAPATIPILTGEFAPDVVLVRIDPAITGNEMKQCLKSANATLESQITEIDVLQVIVPSGKVAEAIATLSVCPGVSYAEPDYVARMTDTIPNDPFWGSQYGLLAIHAPQGWDLNTGSPAVTIAIVDSGVDLGHEDLAGKIVPGFDIVNNDAIPQDDTNNSHGTHVAGIAAAITNNGVGIAGVSWGARIMPVKVLNAFGVGSISDVAAGIIWAADHNADVINLSLGCGILSCPNPPQALEDAVNYAYGKGSTLVASVGNGGSNFVFYPARFPHVIAVAATNSLNSHAAFSNFGPEVDISAPGDLIYSTTRNNSFGFLSGTSMSTAFVSGLAAILSGLPAYTSPDQIAEKIETSALDLGAPGKDDLYGFGLIQMDAALLPAGPTLTPTFTPTFTPTATATPTYTLTATLTATPPVNTPQAALVLPDTGFIPNRRTVLPEQPATNAYPDLGDLWLQIPRLGVELPIVGVPLIGNGWDVSWLGDQAGWLNGTAFPTHAGNSVISAHVYDASGNPGPFEHLGTLQWGDQIIVHAFSQEYVYAVQESMLVAPEAISSVISHEDYPWLTLITCQGYDGTSNSYRFRVVVRAVQVAIK
jgi:LPXTG-site transpeptidase (sortase) family protein